jgi:hypothetical protein
MTTPSGTTPQTHVNPRGESRLYLRTEQIPPFFQAFGNYCERIKTKSRRNFWISLVTYTIFAFFCMVNLMTEFELGDEDEGAIIIISAIGLAIVFFVIIALYHSRKKKHNLLQARHQLLSTFFNLIADDLHPESGLKGILDHGKHSPKDVYKEKTSPYSGAKKKYYKFAWARLKFALVDGSTLQLSCVDKLKEKGGSIIRFHEVQKSKLSPNALLYEENRTLIPLRRELAVSEQELIDKATECGERMANTLKLGFKQLKPRTNLESPALTTQSTRVSPTPFIATKTIESEKKTAGKSPSSTRLISYLNQSLLTGLSYKKLGNGGYQVSYTPPEGATQNLTLTLTSEENQNYLRLYLPIIMANPNSEKLLRANPALAYGRFAKLKQAEDLPPDLFLTKTLLYSTLDQAELDTAIHGLASQANHLAKEGELPQKSKAYTAVRESSWEHNLLQQALKGLDCKINASEKKFRIQFKISAKRQQNVHLRFDREDLEGHQMIAIQSYCGALSPELYGKCLEENGTMAYGAIGLAHLGDQEMFVVSDNQLAETANPQELRAAIEQIARKADSLEELLTGTDVH